MDWNGVRRAGSSVQSSPSSSSSSSLSRVLCALLPLLAALCLGFELGMLLPLMSTDFKHETCGGGAGHSGSFLQPAQPVYSSPITATTEMPPSSSSSSAESLPYVQSLDADWQQHWLGSSTVSAYRTIADADCLLFHETNARPRCVLPRTNDDLVREANVAYSVCGPNVREMALTSIKSFILHRHSSVTLHFWLVLSPFEQQKKFINSTIARWPVEHQPWPINRDHSPSVFLHYLDMDHLMAANSSILHTAQPFLNLFKQCSTIRLWLPQLLPANVSLVLYMDCDTLVIRDYRQVFAHAQLYSPTQFLSFTYEGTSKQCGSWYMLEPVPPPAPQPYAINAGIMLINLTRARSNESLYSQRLVSMLPLSRSWIMGDQDIYNRYIGAMQRDGRDLFFPLPFSYNWRECSFVSPGQDGGMTIMHGNGYKFHNAKGEPFWAAMYQTYWLWHKLPSSPTAPIKQ